MIALAGNWLRTQRGGLVNLQHVSDIIVRERRDHATGNVLFIVVAFIPATIEDDYMTTDLFQADTRGDGDAYLAELFCQLHNREMHQLGRTRFEHMGANGYPRHMTSDVNAKEVGGCAGCGAKFTSHADVSNHECPSDEMPG